MNYNEVNERLETLKLVLLCFLLIFTILDSNAAKRHNDEVVSRISSLEAVVQNVSVCAGGSCPVARENQPMTHEETTRK